MISQVTKRANRRSSEVYSFFIEEKEEFVCLVEVVFWQSEETWQCKRMPEPEVRKHGGNANLK
jgi:hypothetical protein